MNQLSRGQNDPRTKSRQDRIDQRRSKPEGNSQVPGDKKSSSDSYVVPNKRVPELSQYTSRPLEVHATDDCAAVCATMDALERKVCSASLSRVEAIEVRKFRLSCVPVNAGAVE